MDRIQGPDDAYYVDVFNNNNISHWKEALDLPTSDLTTVFKYANGWGSFKLVQATLDAMEHFRETDYDYFINLSGQCYPLRPMEDIKQRLVAARGRALMEHEPFPRPRWSDERGGYRRVDRYWFKPFRTLDAWSLPRLNDIPLGMRPYGGSQWFCLPRRHVDLILDLLEENPEIVRFFRHTFIPDEMFFQTILMNSELADEVVNDNKRFTDWSKKCVPTPAILLSEDLPRLERSGMFFARKFDQEMDPRILDLLDLRLLKRPAMDGDGGDDSEGGDGGILIRTVG